MGNCSSTEVGATLIWSPDGKQSILSEQTLFLGSTTFMVDGRILLLNPGDNDEPLPLQLSDTVGSLEKRIDIGLGIAPFWITNDLFGFIQPASGADRLSDQALVLMSPDELQAEVTATTADLREQIPEDNLRNGLFMRYAIAHPTNPDLLLVMASFQTRNRLSNGFLFQLNRQTGAIELLFELDLVVGLHTLGFSPDGHFLITTDSWLQESIYDDNIFPFGRLYVYDFETAEHQTILTNNNAFFPAFIFDWSADGNWLAINRGRNMIDLIAPAYNYQQTVIHQAGDCALLAWVNPIP
ncbi:hypothetical protein MNBD_CHLOROFLEXI01-1708 [hydrothermal vent metagenome]|uniref:TolB protein, periplasmic protein involved in the tonb-independent uptake of group A colicins n=1 Tax=hydrothermal vent metagenome TaxID=652676 RepID=A0A3B0UM90_9ZZZZ